MAGYQKDLKKNTNQLFGDEADAFIESFDKPVVKAFRQNPLKANMVIRYQGRWQGAMG